jgi:hypothetical protein
MVATAWSKLSSPAAFSVMARIETVEEDCAISVTNAPTRKGGSQASPPKASTMRTISMSRSGVALALIRPRPSSMQPSPARAVSSGRQRPPPSAAK